MPSCEDAAALCKVTEGISHSQTTVPGKDNMTGRTQGDQSNGNLTMNETYLEDGVIRRLGDILQERRARSVFLVYDRDAYAPCGAEARMEPQLREFAVTRFADFTANPRLEDIQTGTRRFLASPSDAIVGIGGGSTLDVAKMIGIFAGNEPTDVKRIVRKEATIERKGPLVIAIPTTAGTGSEVTHFSALYLAGVKYSVGHPFVLPAVAIVDAELTYSMPAGLTASTGVDALSQGMESMWAVSSTEESQKYAMEAVRLSLQYKVLAKLKSQGVDENTLVLFIGDNGRPFPRDKTTLYDGGIRTPWLVRWPAKIAPGVSTDALVSSVDIAATFVELANGNGKKPAKQCLETNVRWTTEKTRKSQRSSAFEPCKHLERPLRRSCPGEGKSFAEVLIDPTRRHRSFAFAEDHWHDYEDHARCVVTQRFKLIRNDYVDLPSTPSADAGRGLSWQNMLTLEKSGKLKPEQRTCFISPRPQWELFDLQRDPHELVNRIDDAAYSSVRKQLKDALNRWTDETDDYVPSRRTPDEFDRVTGEPDHSVRVRPRRSKQQMFGTNGKY